MNPIQNVTFSQLQTLYEVSNKINTNLNLKDLLNQIMDLAIELLNAEKGLIFLNKPESGKLEVEIARAMDKKTLKNVLELSRSMVEKVARDRESILVEKTPDTSGASKSIVRFKIKSLLCVPLKSKDDLLGVIYLDTTKTKNLFKHDDLLFLEAFANLAGIAIENAKNYQELDNLNQNLENLVKERTKDLQQKHEQLKATHEELKSTQLQLIQAEKMASLGKLVAGIAHEVNSPLGTIHSNSDVFYRGLKKIKNQLEDFDQADSKDQILNMIQILNDIQELTQTNKEATQRIQKIVQSLKSFARLDEGEIIEVDIHDGINSTLDLIQNSYKDRIEIKKNYGEIPPLRCNAGQLNQVFMNVLVNACEAIKGKGKIQIQTKQDNNNIRIEIIDTGIGIKAENLTKVLDPGFTSKTRGIGTGLGLSISYRIIQEHEGTINLKSEMGKGTTVTITLPKNN
jgi:signal transduction histidine kinase